MTLVSVAAAGALEAVGLVALVGVSLETLGAFAIAVLGVGTLVGVVAIARRSNGARSDGGTATEDRTGEDPAIETLKERYVAGEVDDLEFERRLETLYEDEAQGDRGRTEQREVAADTAGDPTDGGAARESGPVTEATEPSSRGTCGPGRRSSKRSKRRGGGASGRHGCR